MFAYFWSDNDEDWRLMADLEQDNLLDFRKYGSQLATESQFDSVVSIIANNNDLLLYRTYLGRSEVADESDIQVFVDDWHTLNGSANRTWYDGVGYALVSSLLQGDYNGDGVVDAGDYTFLRDNLGVTGLTPYQLADGDDDGQVTQLDYDVWRKWFGASLDSPQFQYANEATAAPEPSTIVLMLLALSPRALQRLARTPS